MKITFLGAARTVTGSMHLLEINGMRILLECGLFEGKREEAYRRNRHLPFDAQSIHTAILSHAHIDHSGNLPSLCRAGFEGNIICTPATRNLCSIMLLDSAHVQETDVRYVNKRRKNKHLPLFNPLYMRADAEKAITQLLPIAYNRPFQISESAKLTLQDAGHILGSSLVVLDLQENGRKARLMFTGDVGRSHMPIIRDPAIVKDIDYLIIESTYGMRVHDDEDTTENELESIVNQTINRGGKIIIPAFSVGRTQQVVYSLHKLHEQKRIPDIPIYVDSPLSVNATEIFRLHPECYDQETRKFIENHKSPFSFHNLTYIRDVEKSKKIQKINQPMIIITASGMCEAGRILHHLRNTVTDQRNTILIIGYCAEHTLGKRIMEKVPEIKIFGEPYPLRAQVKTIDALSAHADCNELLAFIKKSNSTIKKVFIVHGNEEQSLGFAKTLEKHIKANIFVPHMNEEFTLQ
ncbi:MAG: MBL fold metallo-hydrolase [Deltaproteobacteria bacterium]|nr:MBL fold metallo-hydrolase [Deltaproteobacteria bacterium]